MKKYIIKVNGTSYDVEVEDLNPAAGTAPAAQAYMPAPVPAPQASAPVPAPQAAAPAPAPAPSPSAPAQNIPAGAQLITAPMPGTIIRVIAKVGDSVKRAQPLLLLEAMKMENEIMSSSDGKVLAIHVSQGASVNTGDPLVSIG